MSVEFSFWCSKKEKGKISKMVKIDYSFQHTIIEKELLEPRIAGFRTRYLCYLIALLFVAEDAFKLYLTKINYYGLPGKFSELTT